MAVVQCSACTRVLLLIIHRLQYHIMSYINHDTAYVCVEFLEQLSPGTRVGLALLTEKQCSCKKIYIFKM